MLKKSFSFYPPFTNALLPKVAKSIKKKYVSQILIPVDKNGEKKWHENMAWRYITFSVAYDYFVSCFVLTLNRSSELAPALNIILLMVILAYSVPSLKKGKNTAFFLRLIKVNTSSKKSSYIFTRK